MPIMIAASRVVIWRFWHILKYLNQFAQYDIYADYGGEKVAIFEFTSGFLGQSRLDGFMKNS